MALVLIIAAGLWGLGMMLGTPKSLRWVMIGILWLAVIGLHLLLPEGHALRMATGESAALWLILGGFTALVLTYRAGLRRLKARAALPGKPKTGTFSDTELERYARHIVL
ncbi:Molybdopterin-synthase adenylyltransferase, partial [hydrothermal vent metagenome]